MYAPNVIMGLLHRLERGNVSFSSNSQLLLAVIEPQRLKIWQIQPHTNKIKWLEVLCNALLGHSVVDKMGGNYQKGLPI